MFASKLVCTKCGEEYSSACGVYKCRKCGSPLDVRYHYEDIAEVIQDNDPWFREHPHMWKYWMFLPVSNLRKVVTLNEGGTRLYRVKRLEEKLGISMLYVKNEGENPTGAFKDRGSSVEITKALEFHARRVIVASTGNMAASISAYGAKAGLDVTIVVPEGTPEGKLLQARMYGAKVEVFGKTYDEALAEAERRATEEGYYLTGNYHFRVEGQKTTGFEIIDQLHFKVPDWIIVPIGAGTHLRAIWKGLKEFQRVGLIDELPRIAGVQIEGYDAIVRAWETGKPVERITEKVPTIASAIAVKKPVDGENVIRAVRESDGHLGTVTNEETLKAGMLLGREGLFVEPSSATALALARKMREEGIIESGDSVVVVATGHGLKDTDTWNRVIQS
ncbi:threonine synthase [Thermococcus thioreducens]|uniref:Threonine synthase n=1 Tax=Thermococcus thioreducens TaxID=277988 RepID=A0A0Q2UQG4_9EURY|nr:threonine synthase [Thermococcus thioreducens]ASJ13042.1 threonine synthase [Thermococcus thioreducens]KQH82912.1 threonine synthase [Thermococcus thioreducens]SEV81962.1 L-threonine synthase [Thermococcus thioreducens]